VLQPQLDNLAIIYVLTAPAVGALFLLLNDLLLKSELRAAPANDAVIISELRAIRLVAAVFAIFNAPLLILFVMALFAPIAWREFIIQYSLGTVISSLASLWTLFLYWRRRYLGGQNFFDFLLK
jgi:hypothetical protein